MTFEQAVSFWIDAERACVEARTAYELEYANALINADGKAAEIRKAQADRAASAAFRAYQLAAIEARAAEHTVLFQRGALNPAEELLARGRKNPGVWAP